MASTSSKKMMQARLERAIVNNSRTIRAPSPTYFCTSSEPMTRMKHASVLFATARAVSVLPVPGGPYSRTPLGGSIPSATNLSGCKRGVSRTSLSFSMASFAPPTSSYVTSGLSSTVIRLTVGSILGGSGICIEYFVLSTPTRIPSSTSVGATFSPRPTTNLAICFTLITYLFPLSVAPLPAPGPEAAACVGSSPAIIFVHRATCRGASCFIICSSPTRSHWLGWERPVSDSLIPIKSLTVCWCFFISSSISFMGTV
mmetsp:Transcript_20851/g.47169  ORF Transcript_20851/g.47169 Transcript_20851/m.47169 type:complete len:257 (-) Transcript_20851:301-1071(-)